MNANRHEAKVAIATLILVVYTLALSTLTQVISSLQTSTSISNAGSVKAVGVGVYWDAGLTNPVSSINWGIVEPNSNKDVTVYIRNEGNSAVSLAMNASNWNPANASDYMVLTWDYGGQSINVGDVVQVTLTLSVSASVSGITDFSFDIIIVGSG